MMQGQSLDWLFLWTTETFKAEDDTDVFTGGLVFCTFLAGDESKVAAAATCVIYVCIKCVCVVFFSAKNHKRRRFYS